LELQGGKVQAARVRRRFCEALTEKEAPFRIHWPVLRGNEVVPGIGAALLADAQSRSITSHGDSIRDVVVNAMAQRRQGSGAIHALAMAPAGPLNRPGPLLRGPSDWLDCRLAGVGRFNLNR
jgi:hypothetical protein